MYLELCSCCAVLCHHFAPSCQSEDDAPSANQTMTNPQTHTGRATKALQDPTTEAPMAVPAHRLGFGLHRCQTLLPRAAAYLRSLHQPGICIRVAPKMRKRPTSCSSGQAHAHQHKRRHILILGPWIHHASCWRKKPHQVLWHTVGVVPAQQCQHGFECPASTALLLGPLLLPNASQPSHSLSTFWPYFSQVPNCPPSYQLFAQPTTLSQVPSRYPTPLALLPAASAS